MLTSTAASVGPCEKRERKNDTSGVYPSTLSVAALDKHTSTTQSAQAASAGSESEEAAWQGNQLFVDKCVCMDCKKKPNTTSWWIQ